MFEKYLMIGIIIYIGIPLLALMIMVWNKTIDAITLITWLLTLVGFPLVGLLMLLIGKIKDKFVTILLFLYSGFMTHLHAVLFMMNIKPKDNSMSEYDLWIRELQSFNLEAWFCIFMYVLLLMTFMKLMLQGIKNND